MPSGQISGIIKKALDRVYSPARRSLETERSGRSQIQKRFCEATLRTAGIISRVPIKSTTFLLKVSPLSVLPKKVAIFLPTNCRNGHSDSAATSNDAEDWMTFSFFA
jgi:hypothetical protein